jgi:hypothetical protein
VPGHGRRDFSERAIESCGEPVGTRSGLGNLLDKGPAKHSRTPRLERNPAMSRKEVREQKTDCVPGPKTARGFAKRGSSNAARFPESRPWREQCACHYSRPSASRRSLGSMAIETPDANAVSRSTTIVSSPRGTAVISRRPRVIATTRLRRAHVSVVGSRRTVVITPTLMAATRLRTRRSGRKSPRLALPHGYRERHPRAPLLVGGRRSKALTSRGRDANLAPSMEPLRRLPCVRPTHGESGRPQAAQLAGHLGVSGTRPGAPFSWLLREMRLQILLLPHLRAAPMTWGDWPKTRRKARRPPGKSCSQSPHDVDNRSKPGERAGAGDLHSFVPSTAPQSMRNIVP